MRLTPLFMLALLASVLPAEPLTVADFPADRSKLVVTPFLERKVPNESSSWEPLKGRTINRPTDPAVPRVYRLALDRSLLASRKLYVKIPWPHLDEVYVTVWPATDASGGGEVTAAHPVRRLEQRSARVPVFRLPNLDGDFRLRIQIRDNLPVRVPIYLMTENQLQFERHVGRGIAFAGIGFVGFALLWTLLQLLWFRRSFFLWIAGYIVTAAAAVWLTYGGIHFFHLTDAVRDPGALATSFYFLATAAAVQVVRRARRPRKWRLRSRTVLHAVSALAATAAVLVGVADVPAYAVGIPVYAVTLAALARAYRWHEPSVRLRRTGLFEVSWLPAVLFAGFMVLFASGLIPYVRAVIGSFIVLLPISFLLLLQSFQLSLTRQRAQLVGEGSRLDTDEVSPTAHRSAAADESSSELVRRLHDAVVSDELFRRPDLTLNELAVRVGTKRHDLSILLNRSMHTTFYEFLDRYRIPEAQRLLRERLDLSILDVAFACGYNSKATFNRKFKAAVGETPRAYRNRATGS